MVIFLMIILHLVIASSNTDMNKCKIIEKYVL